MTVRDVKSAMTPPFIAGRTLTEAAAILPHELTYPSPNHCKAGAYQPLRL